MFVISLRSKTTVGCNGSAGLISKILYFAWCDSRSVKIPGFLRKCSHQSPRIESYYRNI